MKNKEILGNTYPLKRLFKIDKFPIIYTGGVKEFYTYSPDEKRYKGEYEEVEKGIILKKYGDFRTLLAKTYCERGSHSSFILEWNLGKKDPSDDDINWFSDIVSYGGIVEGRKIIRVSYRDVRIRIARPSNPDDFEKDPNPREINFIYLGEGKDVNYGHKYNEFVFNGDGLIAWLKLVCSSRTGAHWKEWLLVIRYLNKKCELKVKEDYLSCRGNRYLTEKEIKC